jgi:hypothetical protein
MLEGEVVSIGQLMAILVKRKKLVIIFFMIFMLLAGIGLATVKLLSSYSQRIQLTHYYLDGNLETLPSSVQPILDNINAFILPEYVTNYNMKHRQAEIDLLALDYRVRFINNSIVLTMTGLNDAKSLKVFAILNQAVLAGLNRLQQPYLLSFTEGLQKENKIFFSEIASLRKLEKQLLKISNITDKADAATLRDTYILTMGSKSEYLKLFSLELAYKNNKLILKGIKETSMGKVLILQNASRFGPLKKFILLLILPLFISILMTMIVEWFKNDNVSLFSKNS